jgi:phage I-like protein
MSKTAIGIAVCAIQRGAHGFQVFPPGEFRAGDGRPQDAPYWIVANPQAVLAKAAGRKNDFLIDYEHQSLVAARNGQPAPAAGWFAASALEWREGGGMFVNTAKMTAKATQMIDGDEYRYISPVFLYDKAGNVLELLSVGLTNDPALDGMAGIAAAASKFLDLNEETQVEKELLDALGLADGAKVKDAVAAIAALKQQASNSTGKLAALRSELADARDPAKYVPAKMFDDVQKENVALRKAQISGVMKASASKLPSPELREWAEHYGEVHGADELEKRLAAMSAMPALDGKTQSGGKAPDAQTALDASELAVLTALGLDDDGKKIFADIKGANA